MTNPTPQMSWVEGRRASSERSRAECTGVLTDEGLRSLLPLQVALRAGLPAPDEMAGVWVSQMVECYAKCGRPDAGVLAGLSMSRLTSFHAVARVVTGFEGHWWSQHVSELLGWVDPPAVDPCAGELAVAMLHQIALALAAGVLALDGRRPDGSLLPTNPAIVVISQQKGQQ